MTVHKFLINQCVNTEVSGISMLATYLVLKHSNKVNAIKTLRATNLSLSLYDAKHIVDFIEANGEAVWSTDDTSIIGVTFTVTNPIVAYMGALHGL